MNRSFLVQLQMTARTAFLIIAIIVLSLGLTGYLNYSNFEKTQRELNHSRMGVMGSDLKQTLLYGLGLGLQLDEMRDIEDQLQRARQMQPDILRILILNEKNTVLYATEPALIGSSLKRVWNKRSKGQSDNTPQTAQEATFFSLGFSLKNPFGLTVGQLILDYDRSKIDEKNKYMASEIFKFWLSLSLISSFFVFLGVFYLNKQRFEQFERMNQQLEGLLEKSASIEQEKCNRLNPIEPTFSLEKAFKTWIEKIDELLKIKASSQKKENSI